jgi:predicted phage terminase large subunit-like protein
MTTPPLASIGSLSPARLGEITGRGNYKRNRMVNFLNRELMGLFSGEFDNLAVAGPPRHGKTRLLTELGSAYFLGTNPTRQVIVASHSATLASKFGKNVRDFMREFGPDIFGVRVRDDWSASDNWGLTDGGGMLSIGVGGSLVGHGADLFIFDDVIADAASALSETVRNNTMDWYESTAETRINAGGLQIFTMQRWHDDDPYRRIVKDNPDRWRHAFDIRAIAEEDDVLGRPEGEALWPEKYPIDMLREMERRKAFWFAAQYQQRPVPRGGGMFHLEWIEDNAVWYRPTTDTPRIRWWDLAATEGDGDYTVGALLARKGDNIYIEDIVRGQWGSGNRDRVIRQTCEDDNRRYPNGVVTWFEQEPGSAGKVVGELSTRKLAPFAAHAETSSGQKDVRADGLAGAFSRGDVHVCKGLEDNRSSDRAHDWYGALVVELTTFPGKHDDIVDACSGAFNKLVLEEGDRVAAASWSPGDELEVA